MPSMRRWGTHRRCNRRELSSVVTERTARPSNESDAATLLGCKPQALTVPPLGRAAAPQIRYTGVNQERNSAGVSHHPCATLPAGDGKASGRVATLTTKATIKVDRPLLLHPTKVG